MSDFALNIIINIVIGFVVIFGFLGFWAKSSGAFNKNGAVYEYFKKRKANKKKRKVNKK